MEKHIVSTELWKEMCDQNSEFTLYKTDYVLAPNCNPVVHRYLLGEMFTMRNDTLEVGAAMRLIYENRNCPLLN